MNSDELEMNATQARAWFAKQVETKCMQEEPLGDGCCERAFQIKYNIEGVDLQKEDGVTYLAVKKGDTFFKSMKIDAAKGAFDQQDVTNWFATQMTWMGRTK